MLGKQLLTIAMESSHIRRITDVILLPDHSVSMIWIAWMSTNVQVVSWFNRPTMKAMNTTRKTESKRTLF